MKAAAVPLSVALTVASGAAFARSASDPIAHLRACSLRSVQSGWNVWKICHVTSRRRLAQRKGAITGLSARPPHLWTIRRSSPPARFLAAARMAPRCSSPFTAALAAPNWWSQDRPSAAARITPYPIASMTIGRCSWRQAHLVWNGRCLRGRRRPLVAVASRGGRLRPPSVDPSRCRPGRAFSARRAEDGARESSRGVQVATRRCQARQLMVIERSWAEAR